MPPWATYERSSYLSGGGRIAASAGTRRGWARHFYVVGVVGLAGIGGSQPGDARLAVAAQDVALQHGASAGREHDAGAPRRAAAVAGDRVVQNFGRAAGLDQHAAAGIGGQVTA